jgi:Ser/Thr protein kinase RdoA (MazF antagonist)
VIQAVIDGMRQRERLVSWNLGEVASTEPLQSPWGCVTAVTLASGERYVLKRCGDPDRMDRELRLLRHLDHCGLPVAVPVPTVTGAPFAFAADGAYGLYPMLPGCHPRDHDSQGANARAQVVKIGEAIGRLHQALRRWEPDGNHPELDLTGQLKAWALPLIGSRRSDADSNRVAALAEGCGRELARVADQLVVQWIHRDPHPGNMLFERGTLSGILDFEQVRRGPRVFDPCYCAASILAGGWEHMEHRSRWPALLAAILSGYQQHCRLNTAERHAVVPMLTAVEVLFLAFSLEQEQMDDAVLSRELLFWLDDNRARIERELT